jgi:hypothetical protein
MENYRGTSPAPAPARQIDAIILNVKRDVLLSAMFVLLTTSLIAAQQTTIRIPFGEDGFDIVTFDHSRVSVNDVKYWMKFAEWNYYGSVGISFSGCDQPATARMTKSLERVRRVGDELNRDTQYPSELLPVVTYLKRWLLFRLWIGEQYIAFVKTRTTPESVYYDPESVYHDIDGAACRVIAERIRNEPDAEKACQVLGNEWTNCTLKYEFSQLGDYPKAQWKAFFEANGIQERVSPPTTDD